MLLIQTGSLTHVCFEPMNIRLKQSGVTTSPLDGVTFVRMRAKYF
jgi:hypothetical protein